VWPDCHRKARRGIICGGVVTGSAKMNDSLITILDLSKIMSDVMPSFENKEMWRFCHGDV
jgi:chemotaxis signal transduction protein